MVVILYKSRPLREIQGGDAYHQLHDLIQSLKSIQVTEHYHSTEIEVTSL